MAVPPATPIRPPVDATDAQIEEIRFLLAAMPAGEIIAGLRFAHRRYAAKDAGVLTVGRRGIVRGEVHSVNAEQARWRLDHWKMMIADYRRRGYSYPTISRIKKLLKEKATDTDAP